MSESTGLARRPASITAADVAADLGARPAAWGPPAVEASLTTH